ncbi:MAG: hypothetical protein FD123_2920 [Bacteroidetes bacterium]|nr:MAG: hypothetical protein FD123_2920 [Bacteroidota bacterium]
MKKIFTLISGTALFSAALYAQPVGWTYVMPVQITNNTSSLVTDYQASLTINTQALIGAGQMLATGDDIRFGKECSGTTLYNYWIESGINTTTTTIWVKVDSIPASGSRTFYMYYGNSSATAVSAVPGTFIGPHSSTDSVASGGAGGATNSQRGFRFAPNVDILMTHFGKREPNGTTRYVTLFNFSTQAVIAQLQVSGPAAQYSYGALASPVWLTQGTQYVCELYQGASDGYYFGTSSQIGQHLTYLDMRYCNSCTQNTFPTNTLNNYHYGYPDFWYFSRNMVTPAPTVSYPSTGTPPVIALGADIAVCSGSSASIGATATGGSGSFTYLWTPSAGLSSDSLAVVTATPSATSTYVLTVTDNINCGTNDADTITVTVNSLPVVALGSDAAFCASTILDAQNAGSTYLWSDSSTSQTLNVLASGTYDVAVTDGNGCTGNDTITVTINPLPAVNLGQDVVQCAGTVTFDAQNAGATYLWSDSTTAQTLITGSGGTFYVTVTDSNGCSAADTVMATINPLPAVNLGNDASFCGSTVLDAQNAGANFAWNDSTTAQTLNVSLSGAYYVTVTDGNGCSAADTINVTINTFPTVNLGSDIEQCGGTATLDAQNAGSTYLWSDSSSAQTLVVSASGTYYVMVTDSNGCSGSDSVLVTINTPPTVTAAIPQSTVCLADAAFTLTGGSPAGGTYSGTGVSGGQFNPSVAGTGTFTITYTYTDGNNCTASATDQVAVSACVGIQAQHNDWTLNAYPNPFGDQLDVVLAGYQGKASIRLVDITGRVIYTGTMMNGEKHTIPATEFPAGSYLLEVLTDSGKTVRQLIHSK